MNGIHMLGLSSWVIDQRIDFPENDLFRRPPYTL